VGQLVVALHGVPEIKALLTRWPVERRANWTARVNAPLTAKELDRARASIERGRSYGSDDWVRRTIKMFGLEHTVRPEGRPRKDSQPGTDTTREIRTTTGRNTQICPRPCFTSQICPRPCFTSHVPVSHPQMLGGRFITSKRRRPDSNRG
jgi:hypothetical protein